MRVFFDRCAPIAIARMVRGIEGDSVTVRHHDEDERSTRTTPDEEWIRALAGDREPVWVVVSGDGRILKNKAQRAVLVEAGLPFFCLVKPWPNLELYEYAWKFAKVWPGILACARAGKGHIFEVHGGSSLKVEPVE
jgi:hypothetical protein